MADHARKDVTVKIRVNPLQLVDLKWAAKKAGLDLSGWLRSLALKEVDRIKSKAATR